MADDKWYFDTNTGEVTEGKAFGWADRMGPYDSREEAENALKIAQQRNDAADEWDDED